MVGSRSSWYDGYGAHIVFAALLWIAIALAVGVVVRFISKVLPADAPQTAVPRDLTDRRGAVLFVAHSDSELGCARDGSRF